MPGELLLINPRKRKAKRAAPKKRTVSRRRKNKASHVAGYYPNPAPVRRTRRRRLAAIKTRVKRASRKYKRNPSVRLSANSIMGMAKGAALGAAGALAVDVLFGYAKGMLPASMQTPTDAAGGINPLYFAAKGGIAVLGGVFGAKVTKHAGAMAEGSLTVSAYEILRSFVPASVNLGYANPAQLARRTPRPASMSKYVSGGVGGYTSPVNTKYMGEFVS